MLTTTRRIKGKIATESDPDERRQLRRILSRTFRKVCAHRMAIEGPQRTAFGGPAIEEQIQIFLMVEHEFHAPDRYPSKWEGPLMSAAIGYVRVSTRR